MTAAPDAAAIADAFGLGSGAHLSSAPVARGRQGVVWRLTADQGEFAVKADLVAARTERELAAPTRLQESAYAAGVPTPRVRRTTGGAVLAEVGGHAVRVQDWVGVAGPDPMLDPATVGATLAGVHRAGWTVGDAPGAWHAEPVGATRWDDLVARLRTAGAPFADQLAGLRDELVALDSWAEPPRIRWLCHRDLWADNLLPAAGGGAWVVDWDDAGAADPSYELGCVLFEFARTDADRARTLVAAYEDAGGPGRLTRTADFSMLIAQLGHLTVLAAEDWLAPSPRTPDRAAAEEWVAEGLDDLHSRRRLEELLEWVGPTA